MASLSTTQKSNAGKPFQRDSDATSAVEPAANPLRDYILESARTIHRTELTMALLRWMLSVVAVFFSMVLVDQWLWPLNSAARSVVWVGFIGGTGLWFATMVLPLIGRKIHPHYAARQIETTLPEMKEGLITWVQLSGSDSPPSKNVLNAVGRYVAKQLKGQDIASVIDQLNPLKLAAALMGLTLIGAIYLAMSPKNVPATIQRLLMPWANVAPATRVQISSVTPGDTAVIQGSNAAIAIQVRGWQRQDRAVVRYSTDDGQTVDQRVAMSSDIEGLSYRIELGKSFGGILQPIHYWIEAGDAVAGPFAIQVQAIPLSTLERVEYEYPKYTRLSPRIIESDGRIEGPEGTRVRITAKGNQPMKSARVEFDSTLSQDGTYQPEWIRDLQVDQRLIAGDWILEVNEKRANPSRYQYRIRSTNMLGESAPEPVIYPMTVVADMAPEVDFASDLKSPLEVAENDTLELEVRASDPDFGLMKLVLDGTPAGTKNGGASWQEILLEDATGITGQSVHTITIAPKNLGFQSGDKIDMVLSASDNRHDPQTQKLAPNIVKSRVISIKVVPPKNDIMKKESDSKGNQNSDDPSQSKPEGMNGKENESNKDSTSSPSKERPSDPTKKPNDTSNNTQKSSEEDKKSSDTSPPSTPPQKDANDPSKEKSQPPRDQPKKSEQSQSKDQQSKDQQSKDQQSKDQQSKDQQSKDQQPKDQQPKDQQPKDQQSKDQQSSEQGSKKPDQPSPKQQNGQEKNDQKDGQSKGQSGQEQGAGEESSGASETNSEGSGGQQGSQKAASGKSGGESSQSPGQPSDSPQGASSSDSSKTDGAGGGDSKGGSAGSEMNSDSSNASSTDPNAPDGAGGDASDGKTPTHDGEAFERLQKILEQSKSKSNADNQSNANEPSGNAGDENAGTASDPSKSKTNESSNNGAQSGSPKEKTNGGEPRGKVSPTQSDQPNKTKPSETQTGNSPSAKQNEAGEPKRGDAKSGDTQSGDTQSGDTKSGDSKSGDSKTEDASQGNTSNNDAKSPDSKSGDSKADKAPSGGAESRGSKSENPQGQPDKPEKAEAAESSSNDQNSMKPDAGTGKSKDSTSKDSQSTDGSLNASDAKCADGTCPDGNSASGKSNQAAGPSSPNNRAENGPSSESNTSRNSKTSESPSGGKSASGSKGMNASGESGSSLQSTAGGSESSQRAPENDAKDETEYARSATDLVLESLVRQREQPDPELLKRMGWNKQQMQSFVDRWKNARDQAMADPSKKKEYEDMLQSLGLVPKIGSQKTLIGESDGLTGLREEGSRVRPPESLRERFEAFRKASQQGAKK